MLPAQDGRIVGFSAARWRPVRRRHLRGGPAARATGWPRDRAGGRARLSRRLYQAGQPAGRPAGERQRRRAGGIAVTCASLGIGGLFFGPTSPEALSLWYRTHLGIGGPSRDVGMVQASGRPRPAVFTPFRAELLFPGGQAVDAEPQGAATRDASTRWSRNWRRRGSSRRQAKWDDPVAGRFASIHDPEGNLDRIVGAAGDSWST